jgi:DNA-binding NarL/FixJ family response regulator
VTGAPIRVVVVDDQDLVRIGLARILDGEPDLEVVGTAGDGQEALRLVERARPDVCLMDIRMPRLDGLTATEELARCGSATRVLVLTTFDLDELVYRALRAGAAGFLLKDAPAEELVRAVRVVAAGDAVLAPTTTRRLLETFARHRPPVALPGEPLTDRERDVLVAMSGGLSNVEIGERLFIAESTVRTHVNRLLTKLGVRDRLQAVVLAYECGLVQPHPASGRGGSSRTVGDGRHMG